MRNHQRACRCLPKLRSTFTQFVFHEWSGALTTVCCHEPVVHVRGSLGAVVSNHDEEPSLHLSLSVFVCLFVNGTAPIPSKRTVLDVLTPPVIEHKTITNHNMFSVHSSKMALWLSLRVCSCASFRLSLLMRRRRRRRLGRARNYQHAPRSSR